MTDRSQADKMRIQKWWALGLVGLGLLTQLTVLYQLKVLHDDLVWILFLSGMSLSMLGLGCYAWAKGRIVFWGLFGLIPLAGSVVALAAITSDLLATRPARQQTRLGVVLVILGLGSYIFFLFAMTPGPPNLGVSIAGFGLVGWALPIIGLACYARGKGYSVFWAAMGVVVIIGPLLALATIGLDNRLSKWSAPLLVRRGAMVSLTLTLPALTLAIVIPNMQHRHPRNWEAKNHLGGIFVAEVSFFGEVGRYGTFDEIGFALAGNSHRYTYRIDNSGKPGTVIPTKIGSLTPDNTVVHAGVSTNGQSFTATATANLDDDPTLDQWHVNDSQRRPIHDVNDRTS